MDFEGGAPPALIGIMSTTLIEVRPAKAADAAACALPRGRSLAFGSSGIIPGAELKS